MQTNVRLLADPFEGARLAYRALHLTANDQDWEDAVHEEFMGKDGRSDDFAALSQLCRDGLKVKGERTEDRELMSYSAGFMDAMHSLTKAQYDALPVSTHTPHHFERYRYQLLHFPERFVLE